MKSNLLALALVLLLATFAWRERMAISSYLHGKEIHAGDTILIVVDTLLTADGNEIGQAKVGDILTVIASSSQKSVFFVRDPAGSEKIVQIPSTNAEVIDASSIKPKVIPTPAQQQPATSELEKFLIGQKSSVTAVELAEMFNADPSRAQSALKGRRIIVNGFVEKVSDSSVGSLSSQSFGSVLLQTGPGLRKIRVDLGRKPSRGGSRFETGGRGIYIGDRLIFTAGEQVEVEGQFQGLSMDINIGFSSFTKPDGWSSR